MSVNLSKMSAAAMAARSALGGQKRRGQSDSGKHDMAPTAPGNRPLDESPTHEARRHGDFEVGGAERGGSKVWRNRASSPLQAAWGRGKVTSRQLAAGDAWEELHHRAAGSVGPRDSLDFSVRGNSQLVSPGLIAVTARYRGMVQAAGMIRGAVVASVVVHWEAIGRCDLKARRFRALVEGLDAAADFLGLAHE